MGLTFSHMWDVLMGSHEMKLVMVGLDAAGKTTVLYKLKWGETVTTIPTVGFNVETIQYRRLTCTVWDIGGQEKIRKLWRHYLVGMHGVIFVLDSSDRMRVDEAREELLMMLREDDLRRAALLVLANKQDLPDAMGAEEVSEKLGLHELRNRQWHTQAASATTGEGIYEGFEWLAAALTPPPRAAPLMASVGRLTNW